jgi:class 3 adenylate cyclase/tetratricopeptide (TPR) repeat protein
MNFDETLGRVLELLQREGRVSYRALKRRFSLDDEYLEDLKAEIVEAKRLAVDEDGVVLVWTGGSSQTASAVQSAAPVFDVLSEGGRRNLTVMFCDLVGSTALSQQLDPEELREVMRTYREACVKAVNRFDGYVAQYLGDGLLVFFSYPAAHEDDAERAVRAGLGIIDELHALSASGRQTGERGPVLQARVGIHTGLVVVGDIPGGPRRDMTTVVGETPNLAARIQQVALPGTVVISAATNRLVHGLFICQDLDAQALKGISEPVRLYRVLGEKEVRSRFEVATSGGLTPFVGRDAEMELLLDRWDRAKSGAGQIVMLSGEPGIGKSRLAQELRERAIKDRALRMEVYCSPHHSNSAFYPVIRHLHRFLGFRKDDSPQEKLEKLRTVLEKYSFAESDTLLLIASLLSLPAPEGVAPLSISPQKQKQRTLEALTAWLIEDARRVPIYNVWEDLQWADPSTLELIDLLLERAPTAPILVLLTFRPEFVPPWRMPEQSTSISLARLGEAHAAAMIAGITAHKALPADVLKQIVSKTDGVPLFVEELTKMVVESRLVQPEKDHYVLAGPLPPLSIPATLQDSLMARLDRLASLKETAQLGAVLGREFSYELIREVSPLEENQLRVGLEALAAAELLYQRGVPPNATYLFKHALVQDTAYQSLLKSKRLQYHVQVALAFVDHFADIADHNPELVAHHYTEAGLAELAIPYWQSAGRIAAQRSANVEAIRHFTAAIGLIRTLPESAERDQQELEVLTALGPVHIATRGWASAEAGNAYGRAEKLCRRLGETPQRAQALYGLSVFHLMRGEHQTAHELARDLLALAERDQHITLRIGAHWTLGLSLYHMGDPSSSRSHLERGLALYDPREHASLAFVFGQDLGMSCLCYAALALWELGYPEQALKRCEEGLALARKSSHPFSLAWAFGNTVLFHLLRREWDRAGTLIDEGLALATEQGFQFFVAYLTLCRGSLIAAQGDPAGGIDQIREGLAAYQATGAGAYLPHLFAVLAEACGRAGQFDEGLSAVAAGLAMVDVNRDEVWKPELYRLRGELLLQSHRSGFEPEALDAAQESFLQALQHARDHGSKSSELRVAISLAKLWQTRGEIAAARQLVAGIHGWFTEGFETPDLREAAALIEQLELSSAVATLRGEAR